MNYKRAFKAKLRRRLWKVLDMAQTHCGHEGPVEQFFRAEADLVEWVVEESDGRYKQGMDDGAAAEKARQSIARSPG